MVVFHHLCGELADWSGMAVLRGIDIGASGVDMFFVLSGFIMVYSSADHFGRPGARQQFIVRRLIRIVPLYWSISVVLLIAALLRSDLASRDLSISALFASFAFVPWPRPSGDIAPLLRVGWTLNYEMFFYVVFAACIALPRRTAIAATAGILVIVVACGPLFSSLPLTFWSNQMILEFVFGMLIGVLRGEGFRISRKSAFVIFTAGAVGLAAAALAPDFILPRILQWGGPAALMVAACALEDTEPLHGCVSRALKTLGDASYALYLIHPFMSVPRLLLQRNGSNFAPWEAWPLFYATTLFILSIAAAVAVHMLFDNPLTKFLRVAYKRRSVDAVAATVTQKTMS